MLSFGYSQYIPITNYSVHTQVRTIQTNFTCSGKLIKNRTKPTLCVFG